MKKRTIIILISILLFTILAACTAFYYTFIYSPVKFKMNGDELVSQNVSYIYERANFSLEPIKMGKRIGKTDEFLPSFNIFEIKGQENHDWIFVRGMMDDSIYRRKDVKAVDFKDMKVSEIQLVALDKYNPPSIPLVLFEGLKNLGKEENEFARPAAASTLDNGIINELKSSLNKEADVNAREDYQVYSIRLISPEIKGMGFWFYVNIDKEKKVFLGNDQVNEGKWTESGPLLSNWILKNIKKKI